MKKYLTLSIVFVFCGCTPKIISQKSPLINLDNGQCFNFPSKNYLLSKTINEQKLYQLTEKALEDKNIKVFFGDDSKCKNYVLTKWDIEENEYLTTSKGSTISNSYGNINTGIYQYGYVPTQNTTYSYTMPDTTYKTKKYFGTYTLQVGKKENDTIITVWNASQTGELSTSNRAEAEKIEDNDYSIINKMVETMLLENNFKR